MIPITLSTHSTPTKVSLKLSSKQTTKYSIRRYLNQMRNRLTKQKNPKPEF